MFLKDRSCKIYSPISCYFFIKV